MKGLRANLDDASRVLGRRFLDRAAAGGVLAKMLTGYRDKAPVVLAISGGGAVVAAEVSRGLGAALDVLVVEPVRAYASASGRRLGLVVEGGAVILDPDVDAAGSRPDDIDHAIGSARLELKRRALRYRAGRPQPDLTGRTVILVDDGIASGRTMRAALTARTHLRAGRLILAVPVAPTLVASGLQRDCDELVCAILDPGLTSISDSYDDFHPLAEAEILGALARGRVDVPSQATVVVTDVTIATTGVTIEASLIQPRGARGIVVVPCADAAERHRARALICSLADEHLGFLLLDWTGGAARFREVMDEMANAPWTSGLPLGMLALGARGGALVAAVAARGAVPSFCLAAADDDAAEQVTVYFGACFGRRLVSV